MFIPSLALTVAAAFTGAAIYVSLVEQPARLGLALAGSVLGFVAWWQDPQGACWRARSP